ncbi:MAG: chorismate-binding protein [Acidimicrobiia bacterium]
MDIEFAKVILSIKEKNEPFCILRVNNKLNICTQYDEFFDSIEKINSKSLATGFQNYEGTSGKWFTWNNIEVFDESNNKTSSNNDALQNKDSQWESTLNKDEYIECVSLMKQEMNQGKYFLANLTRQIATNERNDFLFACYLSCLYHETPFRFLLNTGSEIVLGLSPERFLKIEDNIAINEPMKGTATNIYELSNNNKELNENTMMIDLARSDLSQICEPQSISLKSRGNISQHPELYQMSSILTGRLSGEKSMTGAIKSILPVSSVTGTPKPYVVKRLKDLEKYNRNIYCGIYGWVNTNDDSCDLAVSIRTIASSNQITSIGIGSGITNASIEEKEWNETELKASSLKKLIENASIKSENVFTSLRVTKDKKVFCLEEHIERFIRHSMQVGISLDKAELIESANNFIKSSQFDDDSYMKIVSNKNSGYKFEISRFKQLNDSIDVGLTLAPRYGSSDIPKFLDRTIYEQCLINARLLSEQEIDDAILVRNGLVSETTRANLLLRKGDDIYTCDEDMILGIGVQEVTKGFRQLGFEVKSIPVTIDFLNTVDEIICINSVRGPLSVKKIDCNINQLDLTANNNYLLDLTKKIYHSLFKNLNEDE